MPQTTLEACHPSSILPGDVIEHDVFLSGVESSKPDSRIVSLPATKSSLASSASPSVAFSLPPSPDASVRELLERRSLGYSLLDCEVLQVVRHRPSFNPLNATLPGQGTQGEHCGEVVPHHCNSCGHSFWTYGSCVQRECPACYEKWASKEAFRASKRLWIRKYELDRAGIRHRIVHCVVSILYVDQTLAELRAMVRQVARQKGLSGELTIFHPFRQDEDSEWVHDGYVHFHVVGVALGDIKPSAKGEGYVWKHIPDRRYNDYRGLRKLSHCKRLIQYLLTHAGIVSGRHCVSWSGDLAYNKFKQARVDEFPDPPRKGAKCLHCGSVDTEPCFQYQLDQNEVNGRAIRLRVQVHAEPEEPPPKRRIVEVIWANE